MATVTITGNTIRGVNASKDNRVWQIRSIAYQSGGTGGGVITPGEDWETVYPVDGVLTFVAESGSVVDVKTPDEVPYRVRIPTADAGLWDTIEAGVAYQPNVAQDVLNAAVANAAPGFIAAELGLQTADAITTDLDAREIGFVDESGGQGHFTITAPDGDVVNISGTLVPPAATWSGVAARPWMIGSGFVNVWEYGATGDGVTDDTTAIQAAFDAGVNLYFPPGDYFVTTQLTGPTASVHVVGAPGARIFIQASHVLLYLGNCADVTFENIIFETTKDTGTAHASGLVYGSVVSLKRVKFIRCKFLALQVGVDGVLINSLGMAEHAIDDVLFDHCEFRAGRMGLEALDHTGDEDPTVRIRNLRVEHSTFIGCGDIATGIALSYSGKMENCQSNWNSFYGGKTIAIEFGRDHQYPSVIGNRFHGLADTCVLIAFTNPNNAFYTIRPTIALNKSVGRSGWSVRLWQSDEARLFGNTFVSNVNPLDARGNRRLRAVGDTYDGLGTWCLYTDDSNGIPLLGCTWTDCDLLQRGPSNGFIAEFRGTGSTANKLIRCRLDRGALLGNDVSEESGTYGNEVWECEFNDQPHRPHRGIGLTDADKTMNLKDSDVESLEFVGTLTTGRTVTFPRQRRVTTIKNSTAYPLTITVPSISSSTIVIPAKGTMAVGFEDTDIEEMSQVKHVTYTPSNVSTDRSYDANSTTVEELADVLGTLIADLQQAGIITP